MSSVQKLPPEVGKTLQTELVIKLRIIHLVIAFFLTFFCPSPPLQQSHSFFKLLSMLTEMQGGPPGMPSFTNLTLARIWEVSYLLQFSLLLFVFVIY